MNITLEPMLAALLGRWELIIILVVLLAVPMTAIAVGLLVYLIIRRSSEKNSVNTGPGQTAPSNLSGAQAKSHTQIVRQCPKCGAQLRSDLPEGLCPACLLQHGIATEGGVPPGTPPFTPPPMLELAKLFPQLE